MKWRPDDWSKQRSRHEYDGHDINCYEAGASAMLAALLKWLDEPCVLHEVNDIFSDPWGYHPNKQYGVFYLHRYLCPQCMKEIRGEK